MSPGPYETKEEFIQKFIEEMSNAKTDMLTYAVIDKTQPPSDEDEEGALAGMISYMSSSTVNLCTEIGFVIVLPPFQRTHVTTHAVGLMLQNAFISVGDGLPPG